MPDRLRRIDASHIRRCFAGTTMPADPLAVDMSHLGRRFPHQLVKELADVMRPAGVLIPIIEREESLSVLLTERAADLKHHAGQVSFPGGGMEAEDENIQATALRETREEVGIEPHQVDVAGFMEPTPTITGFAVTPVVGLISESVSLVVDPLEVETVFEVPLAYLLDARNEEYSEREYRGVNIPVVTFHFDNHRIWGATAGIIVALRKFLIDKL